MHIFKQCAQKRTSMNPADLVSLNPKGSVFVSLVSLVAPERKLHVLQQKHKQVL